jgi:putative heme transporter
MTDSTGGDDPTADGPRRARGSRVAVRVVQVCGSFAVVGLLFGYVLPHVTGASGADVLHRFAALSTAQLAGLFAVWVAALWAYTFVLTGALPGLTHLQALTLNLAGSAVSNLVPFGGALGLGVTFGMTGTWGFRPALVTLAAIVTGVWNVLTKLALPLIALLLLLVTGDIADHRLVVASIVAAVVLAVVVGVIVAALSEESFARWASTGVEAVGELVLRVLHVHRHVHWDRAVMSFRHRTIGLLRHSATRMSLGMVAYALLQALLAWQCLHVVGSTLTVPEVFAGFALGRLLTSVVATPSGVGISETGSAALLVAFGGDPSTVTAGVLLFSVFTYLLEIPVGAIGWLAWALWTPWRRPMGTAPDPTAAG